MGAKGQAKTGGRQKGSKNKVQFDVDELCLELGVDPLEVLLLFTKGDWKALGYASGTQIRYNNHGASYEEFTIKPETRVAAAKEAVKYVYSQKKAVELSNQVGDAGFKIVVQDYTQKENEK